MKAFVEEAQSLESTADSLCACSTTGSIGSALIESAYRVAEICLAVRTATVAERGELNAVEGITAPTASGAVLLPRFSDTWTHIHVERPSDTTVKLEHKREVAGNLRRVASIMRACGPFGQWQLVVVALADAGLNLRGLLDSAKSDDIIKGGVQGFDLPTGGGAVLPYARDAGRMKREMTRRQWKRFARKTGKLSAKAARWILDQCARHPKVVTFMAIICVAVIKRKLLVEYITYAFHLVTALLVLFALIWFLLIHPIWSKLNK